MPPTVDEIQKTEDVTSRFEAQVDEIANEDGTIGDTGATQKELDALESALREDSKYETTEPEKDKKKVESEKTLLPDEGGDDKKGKTETSDEGTEDKLGKDLEESLGKTPEATVSFDPFEITYKASGETKTKKIESVADIQSAFSKADGLEKVVAAKDEMIQELQSTNKAERERIERVVSTYRKKEFADKELEPILDLVRKDPDLRYAILTDKRFSQKLHDAGMKDSVVHYDYEMGIQKADLKEKAEMYDQKDIDTLSREVATEFLNERNIDPETLTTVIELSEGTEDFKVLRETDGRLKPLDEIKKHWKRMLNKNFGLLVADGKIDTKALKDAAEKAKKAEDNVAALKAINRDTKSAAGIGAGGGAGTKTTFARKDGENDMDFNARWLRENPDEARKLELDLKRW